MRRRADAVASVSRALRPEMGMLGGARCTSSEAAEAALRRYPRRAGRRDAGIWIAVSD